MANSIVRARSAGMPTVGARDGNWVWDGSNWVCDPDCNGDDGFPPFGPPVFSGPTQQPPWYPGANGGVSFGAVAPPNPVRGHFWWNGLMLQMFDGAAWVAVSSSVQVTTIQPSNPTVGTLWFNGSTLFIWNGTSWVSIGGAPGSGGTGAGTVVISATAPGNPVAGMQWWDGTVLRVFDGTVWNVVGPGAAAGPVPTTTVTFKLPNPTDISLPGGGGAWSIIPFTSAPTVDTMLGWNASTKQYTPKKAGLYQFTAAGNAVGMILCRNDPGSISDISVEEMLIINQDPSAVWMQGTGFAVMNGTTDFVRLFALGATFSQMGNNICLQAILMP